MRCRWKWCLALSLGCLVTAAHGEDLWRPVGAPGGSFASSDRPVASSEPIVDSQVRPTAFASNSASAPIVPSSPIDLPSPRPMPSGAPLSAPVGPQTTWSRPPDPTAIPLGTANAIPGAIPLDGSTGPVVPPFPGGPMGPGLGDDCGMGCGPDGCGACGLDGCCGGGFGNCGRCCCGPGNRFYVSAEYLLWWLKGSPLPPLVTTGDPTQTVPGAIGPGTTVLFGGNNVGSGPQSGGRLFVGGWLDRCHRLGVEVGGFYLSPTSSNFTESSGGSPVLARPFTDATTGLPSAESVAFPNVLAGTINVHENTQLWGYEANLRRQICCGCNYHVDLIGGFRALGLNDSLYITENLTVLQPPGGIIVVNDTFRTQNRFYGGQLGVDMEYRRNKWFFGLREKVALGTTQQLVLIDGSTTTSVNGASTTAAGGLLALPSNIGHYSRDIFTVVPETTLTVGYQFNNHIRAFVGYNFLYWSNVVRPGNQIDTNVNPFLVPGAPAGPTTPAAPAFTGFHGNGFWAQGLNLGLEFRY